MKNKAICNPAPLAIISDLLQALSTVSSESSERDLTAYDGDLRHKQDLRSFGLEPSDERFATLIENINQGQYLAKFHPDLFPKTPNPSPHLQGTFFEFNYETSIVFRSQYIVRLSLNLW